MLELITEIAVNFWAYVAPFLVSLFLAGVAFYCFFILTPQADSGFVKSECIGVGLAAGALCKWFVQWLFEFKAIEATTSMSSAELAVGDTILAMILVIFFMGAARIIRAMGIPWIVIGVAYALIAVFGA